MCDGKNCKVANNCYRHKAPINELWQSWAIWQPKKGEKCDGYSPLELEIEVTLPKSKKKNKKK